MTPRAYPRVVWTGLLVVLLLITAAEHPTLAVEIFPSSLKLPDSGWTQAELVVRNPLPQVVEDVTISYMELPGVEVDIDPDQSRTLKPQEAAWWSVRVRKLNRGQVSGELRLQIRYIRVEENGLRSPDVVFEMLGITSKAKIDSTEVAAVTVHSTLAELNDFRPGYIYLEVQNKSDSPIEITDIVAAERPEFIRLRASIDGSPLPTGASSLQYPPGEIQPGESRIFPVYVTSGDRIQPGMHTLIFNIFFEHLVDGEVEKGSLVADHAFDVKVFGEGEVLGAFSNISSFLILPGFLMAAMAGIIWGLFAPRSVKERYKIEAKTLTDARFWVIAITLSLLMAWVGYPELSARFPAIGRREYLFGYGFQDIIWMWLFSITIGGGAALLAAAATGGALRFRAWRQAVAAAREFTSADTPLDVLRKMGEKDFSVVTWKVKIKSADKTGYLYQKREAALQDYWVGPIIKIRALQAEDEDRVLEVLEAQGSIADLMAELRRSELSAEPPPEIQWDPDGDLKGPQRASAADLTFLEEIPFVEADFGT